MDTTGMLRKAFASIYGVTPEGEVAPENVQLMSGAAPVAEPVVENGTFQVSVGGQNAHTETVPQFNGAPLSVPLPPKSASTSEGSGHKVSITQKAGGKAPAATPWAPREAGKATQPWNPDDAETMLAYAQLSDDQFRHAMGRAGNRLGNAFTPGRKVDNSAYDAADKASYADTVGKNQDLRKSAKEQQALAQGELKLGRAREEIDPTSTVSTAARSVAQAMFPQAPQGFFDTMSYTEIAAVTKQARPEFDANVKFKLAEIRGNGSSMTVTQEEESESKKTIAAAMKLNSETGAKRSRIQEEQTIPEGYEKNGVQGRLNNTGITKYNGLVHDYQRLDAVAGSLLDAYENVGPQAWPTVPKAEMEADVLMLHQYLNKANANGVMNPGDKTDLSALLPDLNSFRSFFFTEQGPAKIRRVIRNVAIEVENQRRLGGYTPVTAPDTRPGGDHDPAKRPAQLGKAPAKAPPPSAGERLKAPPGMVLVQRRGNTDPKQVKPFPPEKAAAFINKKDAQGNPTNEYEEYK